MPALHPHWTQEEKRRLWWAESNDPEEGDEEMEIVEEVIDGTRTLKVLASPSLASVFSKLKSLFS